jgi:hypothetical protein
MFSILNDEDLKRSFGENGKVIVSKVFNLDIVMNKIELLYKNIVREFNEKS